MHRVFAGFALGTVVMLAGSLHSAGAQDVANKPAYYTEKVRPILVTNCGRCHMDANRKGGLSLQTRESTLKGGRDGAVIVPGDPANSLLVKLIRHEGPANDPMPMPPRSAKMSDADIALVEQWIKAGAVMPPDPPPAH